MSQKRDKDDENKKGKPKPAPAPASASKSGSTSKPATTAKATTTPEPSSIPKSTTASKTVSTSKPASAPKPETKPITGPKPASSKTLVSTPIPPSTKNPGSISTSASVGVSTNLKASTAPKASVNPDKSTRPPELKTTLADRGPPRSSEKPPNTERRPFSEPLAATTPVISSNTKRPKDPDRRPPKLEHRVTGERSGTAKKEEPNSEKRKPPKLEKRGKKENISQTLSQDVDAGPADSKQLAVNPKGKAPAIAPIGTGEKVFQLTTQSNPINQQAARRSVWFQRRSFLEEAMRSLDESFNVKHDAYLDEEHQGYWSDLDTDETYTEEIDKAYMKEPVELLIPVSWDMVNEGKKRSRSAGARTSSFDSKSNRTRSEVRSEPTPILHDGLKHVNNLKHFPRTVKLGPNLRDLCDGDKPGLHKVMLEIGEGQGHIFNYTPRIVGKNGCYRTDSSSLSSTKTYKGVHHLNDYGEIDQPVAFIGTTVCLVCTGVYFELSGNRVFYAHIWARPYAAYYWPTKLKEQRSAFTRSERRHIRTVVHDRLREHAKKYGWKPEDVNFDSLRMNCPIKEALSVNVAEGVAKFLGASNSEIRKVGARCVIRAHGTIKLAGGKFANGEPPPSKYYTTRVVDASNGYKWDVLEELPQEFRRVEYAHPDTNQQWNYVGDQGGWQDTL